MPTAGAPVPPRPSIPGTPAAPPAPSAGMPPRPAVPGAPAAPAPPVAPAAPGAPVPPLRPAGLGGTSAPASGLKTIALPGSAPAPLRPGSAPTGPAPAGQPTAQLPKATIALTPTRPMSPAAPVSSVQASAQTVADDDEESGTGLLTGLAIVGLVAALAFCAIQIMTDRLPDREIQGITVSKE